MTVDIHVCMDLFKQVYGFYPDGYCPPEKETTPSPTFHRHTPSQFPENWYMPTSQYEKGWEGSTWTPIRYTPYRRISHFREHLNRLQFCQFVFIPPKVYSVLKPVMESTFLTTDTYFQIKSILKLHGFSQFNEHIHHLISHFHRSFLRISYSDSDRMCCLFRDLENAFQAHAFFKDKDRKNFVSYYLIVQFVLYIFHYHPQYALPTLIDGVKRSHYYRILLDVFSCTPHYCSLLEMHFIRKKKCYHCQMKANYFDSDLVQLL